MSVADTSVAVFEELVESGGQRAYQEAVLEDVRKHPDTTSGETVDRLAEELGVDQLENIAFGGTIRARFTELGPGTNKTKGARKLFISGKRKCYIGGKTCRTWRVSDRVA